MRRPARYLAIAAAKPPTRSFPSFFHILASPFPLSAFRSLALASYPLPSLLLCSSSSSSLRFFLWPCATPTCAPAALFRFFSLRSARHSFSGPAVHSFSPNRCLSLPTCFHHDLLALPKSLGPPLVSLLSIPVLALDAVHSFDQSAIRSTYRLVAGESLPVDPRRGLSASLPFCSLSFVRHRSLRRSFHPPSLVSHPRRHCRHGRVSDPLA